MRCTFSALALVAMAAFASAQEATRDFCPVTQPERANQEIPVGKPFEIKWDVTKEHSSGQIDIVLLRGPDTRALEPLPSPIGTEEIAKASFMWTPKTDVVKEKSVYGLKIVSKTNSTLFQYSFPFILTGENGAGAEGAAGATSGAGVDGAAGAISGAGVDGATTAAAASGAGSGEIPASIAEREKQCDSGSAELTSDKPCDIERGENARVLAAGQLNPSNPEDQKNREKNLAYFKARQASKLLPRARECCIMCKEKVGVFSPAQSTYWTNFYKNNNEWVSAMEKLETDSNAQAPGDEFNFLNAKAAGQPSGGLPASDISSQTKLADYCPDLQGLAATEDKATPQDSKANPQDPKANPQDSKANPQDSKANPQDSKATPQDSKATPQDSKAGEGASLSGFASFTMSGYPICFTYELAVKSGGASLSANITNNQDVCFPAATTCRNQNGKPDCKRVFGKPVKVESQKGAAVGEKGAAVGEKGAAAGEKGAAAGEKQAPGQKATGQVPVKDCSVCQGNLPTVPRSQVSQPIPQEREKDLQSVAFSGPASTDSYVVVDILLIAGVAQSGNVAGTQGAVGPQGSQGSPVSPGRQGAPAIPGRQGAPAIPGRQGAPGPQAPAVRQGTAGTAGSPIRPEPVGSEEDLPYCE